MTAPWLLPYARGAYGRDVLYGLWALVEADGAAGRIFYAQDCDDEAHRGDLVEFVTYFSAPGRHLLIAMREGGPFGLAWFDRLSASNALLGVWYQRHTARLAREATRLALQYARVQLGYDTVLAWTPWRTALWHGKAAGMQHLATLPGLVVIQGAPHDVHVLRWDAKEEND